MNVLLIDNYDSFTYNLAQYLWELGCQVEVKRNDQLSLAEIGRSQPDRIVISPGPGTPEQAGISVDAIRSFTGVIPILGVCLGHQAIGAAFGGDVVRAPELKHGKTSMIFHQGASLFSGLPSPFQATRYHSLIVSRERFPECLDVTAWTDDGLIMGIRHKTLPVFGVQFHPESVLTPHGKMILENFLCCRS
ncbi:MAG TPA: aminodeoxychorismate/anthranilate synthase component II [Acidobacteriota bacterium]|nr:aminodeoxychorismate/anthranilate synthase component II [Acidobacteriota bacterium]